MAGILKIRNPDTGEFVEIPAIQGTRGPHGVSGVYVGSGDMPEGYNVQIDPDGTPDLATETWTFTLEDGTTVTKVVVLQ